MIGRCCLCKKDPIITYPGGEIFTLADLQTAPGWTRVYRSESNRRTLFPSFGFANQYTVQSGDTYAPPFRFSTTPDLSNPSNSYSNIMYNPRLAEGVQVGLLSKANSMRPQNLLSISIGPPTIGVKNSVLNTTQHKYRVFLGGEDITNYADGEDAALATRIARDVGLDFTLPESYQYDRQELEVEIEWNVSENNPGDVLTQCCFGHFTRVSYFHISYEWSPIKSLWRRGDGNWFDPNVTPLGYHEAANLIITSETEAPPEIIANPDVDWGTAMGIPWETAIIGSGRIYANLYEAQTHALQRHLAVGRFYATGFWPEGSDYIDFEAPWYSDEVITESAGTLPTIGEWKPNQAQIFKQVHRTDPSYEYNPGISGLDLPYAPVGYPYQFPGDGRTIAVEPMSEGHEVTGGGYYYRGNQTPIFLLL